MATISQNKVGDGCVYVTFMCVYSIYYLFSIFQVFIYQPSCVQVILVFSLNGKQHCDFGAIAGRTLTRRPRREIASSLRFRHYISSLPDYATSVLLRSALHKIRFLGESCAKSQELIVPSSQTFLPSSGQDNLTSQLGHPFYSLRRWRFRSPKDRLVRCWFRPPNRESLQVQLLNVTLTLSD